MPKKHNPIKKAEQPLKKGDEKQNKNQNEGIFYTSEKITVSFN
jgi:hypothetical protein